VNDFTYLKSKITSDGKNTTVIICRIAQDEQTFFKKNKLFTTKTLSSDMRKYLSKQWYEMWLCMEQIRE
jgi:hypothetical protein